MHSSLSRSDILALIKTAEEKRDKARKKGNEPRAIKFEQVIAVLRSFLQPAAQVA